MDEMPQTALLLISDLPTWGRVALASAAPLVEAAGFQACCLPTALLSTHGAYPGFVLEPQSAFLTRAWAHLKTLDLPLAGAAIGLVGAAEQFSLLGEIAGTIRAAGGVVLVDPILGDNGRRYGLFGEDYVPAFRALLGRATVTTPNLTEAALLVGEDPARPVTEHEARTWLPRLAALGPDRVLITSAPFDGRPGLTGALWYDRTSGETGAVRHRRLGQGIPGTGDALAARLLSRLARGEAFAGAVEKAVRATVADLQRSRAAGRPALWGPEGPLKL